MEAEVVKGDTAEDDDEVKVLEEIAGKEKGEESPGGSGQNR